MPHGHSLSYLTTPYWKATLGEHIAARQPAIDRKHYSFLGASALEVDQYASQLSLYDIPHIHHAIAACFPTWELELEIGNDRRRDVGVASRTRWEITPGHWEDFVDNGSLLYRLPDGGRRIILLDGPYSVHSGDVYEMRLLSRRADRSLVDSELAVLQDWLQSNHYLKGQAIRPDGTLLPKSSLKSWGDVSLQPSLQTALWQNTVGLLERRHAFIKHGIPQKRGVLLHGPPGTGKTMIGKALASLCEATFIYATAADCEGVSSVRELFQMARRLRPAILFLEDLDLFACNRSSQIYTGPLGELLTQMDGLEENDGVIVVATTNDLEAIEPALKDRPSRFDIVLEVGLPAADERRKILELNLPGTDLPDTVMGRIAQATEGFSGAQVRELAFLAMQEAILRIDDDDPRGLVVQEWDVEQARKRIVGSRARDAKVGFAYREPQVELGCEFTSSRHEIPL